MQCSFTTFYSCLRGHFFIFFGGGGPCGWFNIYCQWWMNYSMGLNQVHKPSLLLLQSKGVRAHGFHSYGNNFAGGCFQNQLISGRQGKIQC